VLLVQRDGLEPEEVGGGRDGEEVRRGWGHGDSVSISVSISERERKGRLEDAGGRKTRGRERKTGKEKEGKRTFAPH
jgi:hypothetical protein